MLFQVVCAKMSNYLDEDSSVDSEEYFFWENKIPKSTSSVKICENIPSIEDVRKSIDSCLIYCHNEHYMIRSLQNNKNY